MKAVMQNFPSLQLPGDQDIQQAAWISNISEILHISIV